MRFLKTSKRLKLRGYSELYNFKPACDKPDRKPISKRNSKHPLTMCSRELAEYTGKQHKHVFRDIEKMLNDLSEDRSKFGHISKDSYGRAQKGYKLPKDLTFTLIAGYNVKLRKASRPVAGT
ncbi:Phage regulatory protein Rha [Pseudovibrio sp. Ad13]|nr:Phage regulatory protein Rha [Pseudovibrio sp. Ad13]